MRRPGEVTEVRNGMLQVTFCRPEACASCGACEGGKKQTVIWVKGEAKVGDIAMVDMPDKTVIRASLIAYGLPLILMLAGLFLGNAAAGGNEAGSAIGAVVGLAISLILLKATEKNRVGKPGWNPQVIEIQQRGTKEE